MIKEEYVSFEVAKLLKDKGFDQNCATYYLDGQVWRHYHGEVIPKDKQIYAAPTQAITMRWLREIKHIHIATEPYAGYETHACFIWKNGMGINWQNSFHTFKTYEEACEEAIKFSLKHLI